MTMVDVDNSSIQTDSQPKSVGLVCGSAAAWRCSTFTRRTGSYYSAINIVTSYYYYYYYFIKWNAVRWV